jgi:hypothetical protein
MSRINSNANRRITGGNMDLGRAAYQAAIGDAQPPILFRAVVIDIITDTTLLDSNYIDNVMDLVDNPTLLNIMTPNSIIAKIISANQANSSQYTVLFPFFSSHIMTPIAPGEQVYVIYEDLAGTHGAVGFWMSRVHGYETFEDVNYTHYDRRFNASNNAINYDTKTTNNRPSITTNISESFQNGGNSPSTVTLELLPDATLNPYDLIFEDASASKYLAPEPVPRWKKRPQELVLQGANNTLIMLGEDRNGPVSGSIQQNPVDITTTLGKPRQAGAIDLIAGRGRYLLEAGKNPRDSNDQGNPAKLDSTAPLIVANSRGYLETDKNPFRTSKETIANPNEGNPSPVYDAARVYIVQQSRVDENYKLVPANGGIVYPDECLANEQPVGTGTLGRSYVVNKADHIRVIARREPQINKDVENIAGTVMIIREGYKNANVVSDDPNTSPTPPDGNLAYVYINKEGKLQLEANEIYLGRATGKAQPYIRYTVYKATIESLQNQINTLATHIKILESTLSSTFAGALGVGPALPIVTLTAAAGPLSSMGASLDAQLSPEKTKIGKFNTNAASSKIFGE